VTTEELAAAGFLPNQLFRILKLLILPKGRDLLLPADPEVMRTVKSGQTTKMSGGC
jgi:hypothetical protein